MFEFLVQLHQRVYPFRPPRKIYDQQVGRASLFARFFKAYAWPHRHGIAIIATLACLEACSGYFLSYLTKLVVDDVLVVEPTPAPRPVFQTVDRSGPVAGNDRPPPAQKLPASGLGQQIDRGHLASRRPVDAGWRLLLIFLAYSGVILLLNLRGRLAGKTRIRIGNAITSALRADIHEKVMRLSMAFHNSQNPGRLLARIVWDVSTVQNEMLHLVINTASQVLMILIGLAILLCINVKLALLSLVILPFYELLNSRTHHLRQDASQEVSHTNSCTYGLVAQKIDAIKAVQAYGREGQEKLCFHRLSAVFIRDNLDYARLIAFCSRIHEALGAIGTNGIIFLAGAAMVLNGEITLGTMLFAHGTAASLYAPVLQLSNNGFVLTRLLVSLRRLADILDEPVEIHDAADAVPFPAPVRQGLTLRNVSFRYHDTAEPILREIDLHIPAGQNLCIMGASGCGKTSLLLLLARIYDPSNGEILVDGTPLATCSLRSMRTRVGFVPQEAQIFSGTVRDNIAYGFPDATPAEIMRAAKAAELHSFVMGMKVQYETIIGEKGATLSGGQRQRLSLARALLTNPELLLLDDCTSALDADTEKKIQDTLERVFRGKTAVIVSQRVSMARRCHRIAVLRDGIIAEAGTHQELLAQGGFYARLHAQQTEA